MYKPIPIKRSDRYGSSFWDGYSYKLQRNVHFFGDLKYDHWILVETDPNILKYCERPNSEKLQQNNLHKAFDMWQLERNGKETFLNIRYKNQSDTNHERLEKWCTKLGYDYKVLYEEDIRGQALYLKNMKWLLPYIGQRKPPIETDKRHILRALGDQNKTIGELQSICSTIPISRIRENIYFLIYSGELIATNIKEVELGIATEVKRIG
ncbi:hypothetical protein [Paenibacillus ehimensis]|uniref:TnsA endonuclease N-terminal domain-containing protein n=1 Tax=Paenibacillus ehimensis TaxID=79264 RepID=A0ABT8VFJ9_9BACL|nr:hypothetical protein [Paenibacillus ehimensis]MDO3679741.1 hypothetical protein [Paenibacillus ehimensis]